MRPWSAALCLLLALLARGSAGGGLRECLEEGAGEVAARGSEEWDKAVQPANTWADGTEPPPAFVVLPANARETAWAINCSRKYEARVVARCGGHGEAGARLRRRRRAWQPACTCRHRPCGLRSASLQRLRLQLTPAMPLPAPHIAGAAAQPGAVLLDLRRMDTVRVAPDGSRAFVGGGARLGQVYHAIYTATNGTKAYNAGSWWGRGWGWGGGGGGVCVCGGASALQLPCMRRHCMHARAARPPPPRPRCLAAPRWVRAGTSRAAGRAT